MCKRSLFSVAAVLVCLAVQASGDKPVPKEREPKTYTVACKLSRKLLVNNGGKSVIETINDKIPDVTTLEATRGEYHSGGKLGTTPFGFQLQFEVRPSLGDKLRFEVTAEDSSAQGGLNPVTRSYRQHVVRHIRLGQAITLELDSNDKGEGIWVELIVREASE
jgi:hypothetical protein